jgi:hypothetical protein
MVREEPFPLMFTCPGTGAAATTPVTPIVPPTSNSFATAPGTPMLAAGVAVKGAVPFTLALSAVVGGAVAPSIKIVQLLGVAQLFTPSAAAGLQVRS